VQGGLADEPPVRADDEPKAAELRDVLTEDLPRLAIADVVVERLSGIGHLLRSVGAPGPSGPHAENLESPYRLLLARARAHPGKMRQTETNLHAIRTRGCRQYRQRTLELVMFRRANRNESVDEQGPLLKLDQIRPNVFTLTATSQELAALVGAARMALDLMRSDPRVPRETLELVSLVLRDYDRALARHEEIDGRSSRPSSGSSENEVSPI
jgi:hypothetical protein